MALTCRLYRLGMVDYSKAWALQQALAAEIGAGKHPPALLLLEHPHTYTFGRRGQAQNLLWDEVECTRRGIQVYWVDRGGDVTYHGPGQLVGYPLLPLTQGGIVVSGQSGHIPQADYVGYVRRLEACLIAALDTLGVQGQRVPGLTGVWVQPDSDRPPAKIAAIGVKVDAHGVSRHGFALNINPDMTYWQGIIGCGIQGAAVTSLADLLHPLPEPALIQERVAEAFAAQFDYTLEVGKNPFEGRTLTDIP